MHVGYLLWSKLFFLYSEDHIYCSKVKVVTHLERRSDRAKNAFAGCFWSSHRTDTAKPSIIVKVVVVRYPLST